MSLFKKKKIVIISCGEKKLAAEIADDFISKAAGLMFRRHQKTPAMFFAEIAESRPAVWNFGMRFPISIIWFNKGEIIGISRLPRFSIIPKIAIPPSACDSFLEIKEGILSAEESARVRITNE